MDMNSCSQHFYNGQPYGLLFFILPLHSLDSNTKVQRKGLTYLLDEPWGGHLYFITEQLTLANAITREAIRGAAFIRHKKPRCLYAKGNVATIVKERFTDFDGLKTGSCIEEGIPLFVAEYRVYVSCFFSPIPFALFLCYCLASHRLNA